MYVAKYPDFDVEVPADVNRYVKLLKGMFPDEAEGIDGLYGDLEDMNLTMNSLMGLSSGDYWPTIQYVLAHPVRCFNLAVAWQQNLDEFLDEHTQDEKLRAVFTNLPVSPGRHPKWSPAVFSACCGTAIISAAITILKVAPRPYRMPWPR